MSLLLAAIDRAEKNRAVDKQTTIGTDSTLTLATETTAPSALPQTAGSTVAALELQIESLIGGTEVHDGVSTAPASPSIIGAIDEHLAAPALAHPASAASASRSATAQPSGTPAKPTTKTADVGQAKAMFAVKPKRSMARFAIYGGLSVAVIGVAAWNVFMSSPQRPPPSSQAAHNMHGTPVASTPAPAPLTTNSPTAVAPVAIDQTAVAAPASAATPNSPTQPYFPASPPISILLPPLPDATPTDSGGQRGKPAPASVARAEPAAKDSPGEPILQIKRNDKAGQSQPLEYLNKAYKALQQRQWEPATTAYQQALKEDSRNADAWLGLAHIAQAQGKPDLAKQHLSKALLYNPGDSAIQAIAMQLHQAEPTQIEAKLLALSVSESDKAGWHAALGQFYAQQQRWNDAQLAFFNALSRSPDTAEYAYNLAISLEHIQQARAALRYYAQAVELARTQPRQNIGFDLQSAERRIAQLSTTNGDTEP
ncbi:MAG: tetratricopeptide repeat protein [Burkholderiaceae bacterium]|jgi:Tfp pilus assembly protein PilF